MSSAHAYKNSKQEEWARWSRRDHANIEDAQNAIFEAVAEETGVVIPARVRFFISVLQGAHGGGEVINEPFQRSHANIAQRLHLTGTQEAREQAVRRYINQLEEYQGRCGYRFFYVERGGKVIGRDPKTGREVYSKTEYTDFIKPVAYDAMTRARSTEQWRGEASKGIKPHPGKAISAEVPTALAQLPRIDPKPDPEGGSGGGTAKVLSLADYKAAREPRVIEAVEKYIEGVEDRGGDGLLELERIEALVSRLRESRQKLKRKDERVAGDVRERQKDAGVWTGYEDTHTDASANTAYKKDADEQPLADFLEDLARVHPPTDLTPPPVESVSESNDLPETPAETQPERSKLEWALYWIDRGVPVFPLHSVFDGICSCTCTPKKCKNGNHRCGSECKRAGKHPIFDFRLGLKEGLYSATLDPEQARAWWKKYPDANVGGRMGGPRRLVLLDFDLKSGGSTSFHDLVVAHGNDWTRGRANLSGSDGPHFFFEWPEGSEPPNTTGVVAPGVDTKGEGGYAVLPGSDHASGRTYRVERDGRELVAPAWLVEAAREPEPEARSVVVEFQERRARSSSSSSGEKFTDGRRNTALFNNGIGRIRHNRAANASDLYAQLAEVNARRCVPPLDDEEVVEIAEHIAEDYAHLWGVDAGGAA